MRHRFSTALMAGVFGLLPSGAALACTIPQGANAAKAELHAWMNAERKARGLRPFTASAPLDQAAQAQACDMAKHNYFAHARPGGPSLRARVKATGYPLRGGNENLAFTRQINPKTTAEIWRKSPAHWAAIIDPANRDVGISLASGQGKVYWVMVAAY